jgi:succinate dehydrogenase/fumarate reductase flavoprotein subunit
MAMGESYDIIILGSGAAGLAAAVTAAHFGARVLVLEKADVLGGTSAWSGGWIWAPGNPLAPKGSADGVRSYLQALTGNHFAPARIDAFLAIAPKMVGFFHENTLLQFELGAGIPDTYGDLPGAGLGGRSVIARPYDARGLGPDLARLRHPLPETTFHGMTIQAGADLRAFLTMLRKPRAFGHVALRLLRHLRDLALYRRGMDLRNGAALTARLLRSALDLGVCFRTECNVSALSRPEGRVTGVRLSDGTEISARKGVILATGGFGQLSALETDKAPPTLSLSVPSARGDAQRLALAIGAAQAQTLASAEALCPVSLVPRSKGQSGLFPHIIDRGKPGVIGVLANGQRFCNEGLGYHDYVTALKAACAKPEHAESWLICDHRFLRRYGLGNVRPAPAPWRQWRKRGYLITASSPRALAQACGIDPDGLCKTLAAWNHHAAHGQDPAFGRGRTAYMRLQGDADHLPNPCITPITRPPFHAIRVLPGSFSSFAGLATDGLARVLDTDTQPIAGLYAAGADAASPFGGFYPAGGSNLGPALTFGFIAGHHVMTGDAP